MLDILTEIEQKILKLQVKLSQTDYIVIKYVEGAISEADYLKIKSQRQAWRDEINRLEKELETYRTNH